MVIVKLLLFLLCVLETLQHLSYPINFCNMASTCVHDSRVVCASSPDGCSRRSFLDQCDMYEYNCDYGTQYMTKVTSSCTSEISKSSIKELNQSLPENDTSDTETNTYISSDTVPLTESTSTQEITTENNNSKENNTNKSDSDTTVNPTTYVYCCDMPLTWETTTEVTNIFDITINNNSDEETKQTTETSTEYNITDLYNTTTDICDTNITFTTTNQQISDTIDTTIVVNTETDEDLDKKESTIEIINQTTTEYCCDRPLTWESTTEVTKNYEDNTINDNSDENKQTTAASIVYNITDNVNDETTNIYDNNVTFTTINQQISDTVTIDDTTMFVNTETKEAPDEKQSTMDVNQTTTEYCCNRPLTWETTTEVTTKIENITNDTNNSKEEKLTAKINDKTDDYDENTLTYSITPPTQKTEEFHTKISLSSKVSSKCHNKCQRPITWLTTRRGRKHYWN